MTNSIAYAQILLPNAKCFANIFSKYTHQHTDFLLTMTEMAMKPNFRYF